MGGIGRSIVLICVLWNVARGANQLEVQLLGSSASSEGPFSSAATEASRPQAPGRAWMVSALRNVSRSRPDLEVAPVPNSTNHSSAGNTMSIDESLVRSEAALSRGEGKLQNALTGTRAALARLRGGRTAQKVVRQGQHLNGEIEQMEVEIREQAQRARKAEAVAKVAAGMPDGTPISEAAVTQKLTQAELARDQAMRMLRQSEHNKAQAAKMLHDAEKKTEAADRYRVAHAGEMVKVHDEAHYTLLKALAVRERLEQKLEANKGLLKLVKLKEKKAEDQAASEKAKRKEEQVEDKGKLKMQEAKDNMKMKKLEEEKAADDAKIKLQATAAKKENAAAAASKMKVENLEAQQKRKENAEKLQYQQQKGKLTLAKEELKRAKEQDKESFAEVKKAKMAADTAVKNSLKLKVSVQKGAPVDPAAVTAARKAALALDHFDAAKKQSVAHHEDVIDATKQLIKDKIAHRYMKLKHETRGEAKAEAKDRNKRKKKKQIKKDLKKAEKRGRERERRVMQRARDKVRKKAAKELQKQKKIEQKDVKKAKAAVKRSQKPVSKQIAKAKKVRPDNRTGDEKKADETAEVAINKAFSNIISPQTDANCDEKKPCDDNELINQ